MNINKMCLLLLSTLCISASVHAYTWKVHNMLPVDIRVKLQVIGINREAKIAAHSTKSIKTVTWGDLVKKIEVFAKIGFGGEQKIWEKQFDFPTYGHAVTIFCLADVKPLEKSYGPRGSVLGGVTRSFAMKNVMIYGMVGQPTTQQVTFDLSPQQAGAGN